LGEGKCFIKHDLHNVMLTRPPDDALFTISHSIWMAKLLKWKERLELINNMMKHLISGFEQESIQQLRLEHVRDNI
jgi:hypothetical protein